MTLDSADAVVIGAGVRGLAIAYSLKKAGVDVAVIEKRYVAAGASGLNMGYINVSGKGPPYYTELSKMSADMYPAFNDELGGDFEYEHQGSFRLAETENQWSELAEIVDMRNQVPGVDMRMLGIDEIRRMEPALSPHVLGGYWCPIDGGVNALKLTRSLARAAVRAGVRLFTGSEVSGLRVVAGRVEEVVCAGVRIATHVVVNTAGIHAPRIAKLVGIELPVYPERGQLVITEALPSFLNHTIDSYKQFENGQVLLGVTNENVGEDTGVTTDMISGCVRRAIHLLPPLKAARGIRCAAALRPMTPDRLPIYQKMEGLRDFYIAVGHSGITLAPVTGKIFSELITKGETDISLSAYRVERFQNTEQRPALQ